jgi:hypothetical protein
LLHCLRSPLDRRPDIAGTPYLPPNIAIPDPLLPTKDSTVRALYNLAIAEAEIQEAKNATQNRQDWNRKMGDIIWYKKRVVCIHNRDSCSLKDKLILDWGVSKKFYKQTEETKQRLMEDMKIEGLIKLGRRLKTFNGLVRTTYVDNLDLGISLFTMGGHRGSCIHYT